jgi:RNA polymerase primary sigma factor
MRQRSNAREVSYKSGLQEYFGAINDTPLLTVEMERELARRIAQGDPYAREHMVKANLRLVVNIARGYVNKGLPLEDLIEEGNLGLLRAVEGFDETQETRFSTYASYWIKQSIRRALMNYGKMIRLPAYLVSLLAKVKRASTIIAERKGEPPTVQEIGALLNLTKKKTTIVETAIVVNNLTPHSEGGDEDGLAISEVLTDERSRPVDEVLIEQDEVERVLEGVSRLDDREAAVIRMRFGLEPYPQMTLREVGVHLNLTRERVRQLEAQAIIKLGAFVHANAVTGGKIAN